MIFNLNLLHLFENFAGQKTLRAFALILVDLIDSTRVFGLKVVYTLDNSIPVTLKKRIVLKTIAIYKKSLNSRLPGLTIRPGEMSIEKSLN